MRRTHEHGASVSEEAAFELGVVYTTIKNDIVAFTAKEGNSYTFADVATRVARLLESEALRQQYRSSELVPEMRQNGSGHRRGRPPRYRSDELGTASSLLDGAPRRRPLSSSARKAIGKAQRERWAKYHREQVRVKGSPTYEKQRAAAKAGKRDYAAEYWKRKAIKKQDGSADLRFTPEARAKQAASMQKHYRDPKWRKAMLKRMAAMRARKNGKPVKRMSEETKAKIRAARKAYWERKRRESAA